jgi:hypothetical protein
MSDLYDTTSDEEYWTRRRREFAELEVRYEAINKAWVDSGIPVFVLQTPDWQDGWRALHDWLKPHFIRTHDLKLWESTTVHWPHQKTAWEKEIHIISHVYSPGAGHCPEHATIEEEGTRAILAWWNERSAKS